MALGMDEAQYPFLLAAAFVFLMELASAMQMKRMGKPGLAKILLVSAFVLPLVLLAVSFGVVGA